MRSSGPDRTARHANRWLLRPPLAVAIASVVAVVLASGATAAVTGPAALGGAVALSATPACAPADAVTPDTHRGDLVFYWKVRGPRTVGYYVCSTQYGTGVLLGSWRCPCTLAPRSPNVAGGGFFYARTGRTFAYMPAGNNPTLSSYDLKTGTLLRRTVPRQVIPSLGPDLYEPECCTRSQCKFPIVVKADGSMGYMLEEGSPNNWNFDVAKADKQASAELDHSSSVLGPLWVSGDTLYWKKNGRVEHAPFF